MGTKTDSDSPRQDLSISMPFIAIWEGHFLPLSNRGVLAQKLATSRVLAFLSVYEFIVWASTRPRLGVSVLRAKRV